jgi:hypothetical protein
VAILQTLKITQAGVSPGYQAASAGGDQYTPSSTTFLAVKNGSGSQITLTVVTTATAYGQPIGNIAVPIAAGAEVFCGPFDPGAVQQPGSSLANLTYSGVSQLSIAAISCPPS